MKKNFIVTCHGWSASNWLAYILNQHEQVLVSHSAANLIDEKLSNDINGQLKAFHNGYLNRQNRPLDQSYDAIENYGEADVYGSVHLYRLRDLPVQYEKFGAPGRLFNVANLVRHPLDLVWSGYGQFKELFRTDLNELYWTVGKVLEDKEFLYHLNDTYNLALGEYDNLAFIGAARVLGSLRLDLDAEERVKGLSFINYLGIVKMEDVTQNPETLRTLIERLTDATLDVPEAYLEKIYKIGTINQHKQDNARLSPGERYAQFKPWQKEVLHFYLDKYDIVRGYEAYGYTFDFLDDR